ncbi:Cysteine--tRNA ligase [uncultured archaeon]|nr:Cysteine--tRNA ligase [uncultured archaeon]
MAPRVYNTLSRTVEDFQPNHKNEVKMYVCGITVYDRMHIGHARTYIAFDVIRRYLMQRGYKVTCVQNVTDVDDKIIKRGHERNIPPLTLSEEYAKHALSDQDALGIRRADHYPKASQYIPQIIALTETLIKKGHAYALEGDVYFDVESFPQYGNLSKQNREELQKHRVEPNPKKRNPGDFALWKAAKEGEISWDSPWGKGRPGWHIECSAMSTDLLGGKIDIHGGAVDLIFPHHENEIAQSEAATGEHPFVKYWLHTGFLNIGGEKMSKSLGNFLTVEELLKKYDPQVFRLFVIGNHYRQPVDFTPEKLDGLKESLKRLTNFKKRLTLAEKDEKASDGNDEKLIERTSAFTTAFNEAMESDFATPEALAAFYDYIRDANTLLDEAPASKNALKKALKAVEDTENVFGLNLSLDEGEVGEDVADLIEKRNLLRKQKKWAESDAIRDTLLGQGIRLIDGKDGSTSWERLGK